MNINNFRFTQNQIESTGWRKFVINKGYGHYEYKGHNVFIPPEVKKGLYFNEINKLYWQELMEIDKKINEPRLPTKGSYEDDINYFFELIGQ